MDELGKLLWDASKENLRKIVYKKASEYLNSYDFERFEIIENFRIIGVLIYKEELDHYHVCEIVYLGNNHYKVLRMIKFLINLSKKKKLIFSCLNENNRLIKFYLGLGCKVLSQDFTNTTFCLGG